MDAKTGQKFESILDEPLRLSDRFKLGLIVLGVTGFPNLDVFLENSQTALTPPPRPFLEITLRFFPENPLSMRKFAMKFFGLAMAPPPLPPFWKLHCAFLPKIYRFETNKICNVIFWIGNDPPPPLRKFSKKTSILENPVTP